jgi:hypothetical protein
MDASEERPTAEQIAACEGQAVGSRRKALAHVQIEAAAHGLERSRAAVEELRADRKRAVPSLERHEAFPGSCFSALIARK